MMRHPAERRRQIRSVRLQPQGSGGSIRQNL